MSLITKNLAGASEHSGTDEFSAANDRISPKNVREWFGTNLEPLNKQISYFTQLLIQLIQEKLPGFTTMAVLVLIAYRRVPRTTEKLETQEHRPTYIISTLTVHLIIVHIGRWLA